MNKENDSIALVVAPVHDLMFHHLAVAVTLLRITRDNISLCIQMTSLYIESLPKDSLYRPSRTIFHSRKSLKATLLEIDKLIKKVELDCDRSLKNGSTAYDTDEVTNE
ncbi:hypothetical protein MiAbW_03627 [Microcystis aeruginosa NIES-4325]|uniref:Uncharacterized protein n=1 Tax=Microcystis aeruginosa NIES-4325 TaxID=2569534 RepID=A0A5J4FEW0_MICAE|nr:hypothetical protein [Microcystis aeruginosa]GEA29045.1 hypothetical protein MiAbW_03627 [Microcystis aeruginosa NIES-4325]